MLALVLCRIPRSAASHGTGANRQLGAGLSAGSGGVRDAVEQAVFRKGGITGDLEVQALGKTLVPVMTLRGLSDEMLMAASMAGKAEASMQFGGGARSGWIARRPWGILLCARTKMRGQATGRWAAGGTIGHSAAWR